MPGRPAKRRPALPPLLQTTGVSFPGLIKQLPQHKPWMITIGVISVLVVLGACGFSSYLLLRNEGQPIGVIATGPAVERRDISSRETDPEPLTVDVVFPTAEIAAAEPDLPPYTMVGDPQALDDCRYAADGQVKSLLQSKGCSQFIRASFLSYDGRYHATVGVLNLPDRATANDVANNIKSLAESDDGTLNGYVSDPAVNGALFRAQPHLHMEVYGHFLLYGLVVHKDASPMAADDQGAKVVVYDLVQTYLINVIKNWAVVPASSSDDPALSASDGGSPTG